MLEDGRLQFYDRSNGERLLSPDERAEAADARAKAADARADEADARAAVEAQARREAEARLAQLEALLRRPPSE